jgi:hypothetical protein
VYQQPQHYQQVPPPQSGQTPAPPALDEDKVLIKKMASLQGFLGSTIDGTITLSENALVFKPRIYQVLSRLVDKRIVMPLLDIESIVKEKALFVFNTQMKINLRSGTSYTLLVMGRDVFINALEQQIKLVGGSGSVLQ